MATPPSLTLDEFTRHPAPGSRSQLTATENKLHPADGNPRTSFVSGLLSLLAVIHYMEGEGYLILNR